MSLFVRLLSLVLGHSKDQKKVFFFRRRFHYLYGNILFFAILSFLLFSHAPVEDNSPVINIISGTVFKDLNKDTLNNAGDVGAENVNVILYEDINADGQVDGGDVVLDTVVTSSSGNYSFTVNPTFLSTGSVVQQVNVSLDDVEEMVSGCVECNGPDTNSGCLYSLGGGLDLGSSGCGSQVIGLRFNNLNVPVGATITSASVEFVGTTDNESNAANFTFTAEDADNAATFALLTNNVSGRTPTTASVNWNSVPTWHNDSLFSTPDLSLVIQEVVDRAGWASNNSIVIVATGTGERSAHSYDNNPAQAPKLTINYTLPDTAYYVIETDVLTLPVAAGYTTDNVETAILTTLGQSDTGNDFGTSNEHIISGNLFDDVNVNSIQDNGEVGQSGMWVDLYQDVNQDGLYDGGDVLVNSSNTSSSGYYSFLLFPGTISNISRRIDASANDVEENVGTGSVFLTGMDIDFTYDNVFMIEQIAGLRFTNLNIPPGANIISAQIQFRANSVGTDPLDVVIAGEKTNNASIFTTTVNDVSGRTPTNSSVVWNSVPSWTAGSIYNTPDLSSVIEEIIDQPGWASGNAMSFMISGAILGERAATSWDNNPLQAANLIVSYNLPSYPEYYVLKMDETTLPVGAGLTTSNTSAVVFNQEAETDINNNFGYTTSFAVNAGPDRTICFGESTTLTASYFNGDAPVGYVWDNGLGAGASHLVSPSVTTTYNVTATDFNGIVDSDQVIVTVNIDCCAQAPVLSK